MYIAASMVDIGKRRALGLCLLLMVWGCEDDGQQGRPLLSRPTAPGAQAVKAELGKAGGVLTLAGKASLSVPAGALSQATSLGLERLDRDPLSPLPSGLRALSFPYAVSPFDQTFSIEAGLQLSYPEADASNGLTMLRLDTAEDPSWEPVAKASFSVGVARARIGKLGIFVIAGPLAPDRDAGS